MRHVWPLYLRELRSAFRERNLLVYGVFLPLFTYPLVLWLVASALTLVEGERERRDVRVGVLGEVPTQLRERLQSDELPMTLVPSADEATARDALARGDLQAVLRVESPPPGPPGALRMHVLVASADADGRLAEDRLVEALETYREALVSELLPERVVATRLFAIEPVNVTPQRDMGAFVVAMLVPATMLVMIGMGTIYPAIDTVAGERERKTWETTLSLACPRMAIAAAKYLYVVTMGALAGLLNLIGMSLALSSLVTSLLRSLGDLEIILPWAVVPYIIVCDVALAALIAALVLLPVTFARTFREGQVLSSPVIVLLVLPALVATLPAESVPISYALIPAANLVAMFAQVLQGIVRPDFIVLTLVTSGLVTAASIAGLAALLRNEALQLGIADGRWLADLRARLRWRGISP